MATTIFAFATCSLCLGTMYDENDPSEERHCWLGRCSHRLCVSCASRVLNSRSSMCPVCRTSSPFKRVYFANASHIVELLCSTLSEAIPHVFRLQARAPISAPLLPSPSDDLFTIPLVSSSKQHIQQIIGQKTHLTQTQAPQDTDSFEAGFSTYSSIGHQDIAQLPEPKATASTRRDQRTPTIQELEAPLTRREKLDRLEEDHALDKDISRLTSKVPSTYANQRTHAKKEAVQVETVTQAKKMAKRQPRPSVAPTTSTLPPSSTNRDSPSSTKKIEDRKASSKAFIASLRAQFDE